MFLAFSLIVILIPVLTFDSPCLGCLLLILSWKSGLEAVVIAAKSAVLIPPLLAAESEALVWLLVYPASGNQVLVAALAGLIVQMQRKLILGKE